MLESIFPRHVDNTFRGHKLALWLFGFILLMKTAQGAAVLFGGASIVSSADGIPLDTYAVPAAQTIVSLWALLGLTRLLISLLCLLVLVRYRSLLPFMFGFLLVQDVGRQIIFQFLPIARVGAPVGPTVNLVLMGLTLVGLVLSLLPKGNAAASAA